MRLKVKFEIVTSGNEHGGEHKYNLIIIERGLDSDAQGEVSETLKVSGINPVLRFVCCIPYTSVISCLIVSSAPLVSLSLCGCLFFNATFFLFIHSFPSGSWTK